MIPVEEKPVSVTNSPVNTIGVNTVALNDTDLPTQGQFIPNSDIFLAINLALVPLICFGNLLVIIAICKNQRLRTPTNYFILSLAVSDLLVGIGAPYFSTVHYSTLRIDLNKFPCLIGFSIMILSCGLSLANLVGISVERYISIQHPYKYVRWVTPMRVKVVICLIWIYGCIFAFLPLVWNTWRQGINCGFALVLPRHYLLIIVVHLLVFLTVTAVLYTKIFITAKKVQAEIKQQEQRFWNGVKNFKRQANIAKVLAIVLGCFYVCWMPFLVTTGIRMLFKKKEPLALRIVFQLFVSLAFSNSCMNFIIYAWKSQEFKSAFKRMFGCTDSTVDIEYTSQMVAPVSARQNSTDYRRASSVIAHIRQERAPSVIAHGWPEPVGGRERIGSIVIQSRQDHALSVITDGTLTQTEVHIN